MVADQNTPLAWPYIEQLFALREGWGAAPDNLPTRQNNPLDLEHAPDEDHPADAPNSIGSFATPALGWKDGLIQLQRWAARNLTVADAIAIQAPAASGNNTAEYITFVCGRLGCAPETPLSQALLIPPPGESNG